MASVTGWIAAALIVLSAAVPLAYRARMHKRAAPSSPTMKRHVVLGLATSAVAFAHTIAVIPALGSPAATAGGMLALLPGGAAFFLLIAHAGLGLQLRDERLRDRAKKRRMHATTAALIAVVVAVHAVVLQTAAR